MKDPFAELEALSSHALLDLWTRALSARLLALSPGHPALLARARPIFGDDVDDPRALGAALERATALLLDSLRARPADPLAVATAAFSLSGFELELILLSLLPELDERLGEVFATLRGGAERRRPSFGLAARALAGEGPGLALYAWIEESALWRRGLLRPCPPETPLAERELCPSPALRAGLLGAQPARLSGGRALGELAPDPDLAAVLEIRPSLAAQVGELVRAAEGERAILHLVGADPQSLRLAAGAVAARTGRRLLHVAGLGAGEDEALLDAGIAAGLEGAALALALEGEGRRALPEGLDAPGALIVLSSPGLALLSERPVCRREPPRPLPSEQVALWTRALGGGAPVELLAAQTRVPPQAIRAAAARARQAGAVDEGALRAALAELLPPPEASLAASRRPAVPWEAVVLPERPRAALTELLDRVRHRATVQDRWGLGGPDGRGDGIIALLHGESGTGKTLCAEALAAALGLPMLQVDLSQVVSKYIGETEKNLAAVFDAAEGFRALLFFDEADALFGRRTAVKDAHDRYANVETNYLLMRLEAFEGISVLASNRLQDLDEAFLRRIPFVIALPRPDRAHQRLLWERHLPAALRGEDVDLDAVLRRYDLVGGEVRAAAITAAYAAAKAGGRVSQAMIVDAARRELAKKGRVEG